MSMSFEDCMADVSYSDMGICPECHDHCTFIVTDENGDEIGEDDPNYDDQEPLSDCCGA